MQREVSIRGTHAGSEVIFKRADHSFGGIIAAMNAIRRGKSEVHLFVFHELLKHNGGFVVESLEYRLEVAGNKQSVGFL
jgi:hypothetical protein